MTSLRRRPTGSERNESYSTFIYRVTSPIATIDPVTFDGGGGGGGGDHKQGSSVLKIIQTNKRLKGGRKNKNKKGCGGGPNFNDWDDELKRQSLSVHSFEITAPPPPTPLKKKSFFFPLL